MICCVTFFTISFEPNWKNNFLKGTSMQIKKYLIITFETKVIFRCMDEMTRKHMRLGAIKNKNINILWKYYEFPSLFCMFERTVFLMSCLYKPRGTLAILVCIMNYICTVYHVFQTTVETARQQKQQLFDS